MTIEAYSIAVTLKLNDLISPALTSLMKQFEKLDGIAIGLNRTLAKIDLDSAGFKGLASSANATNRAFERATVSAATFQRELAKIHAMNAMPRGPGGGGGGGNGGHGGNMHVGPGGVGLGSTGFGLGDAYMPLLAASAAASGSKALFERAKDLNTEQARFRLFGMTEAQNQDAFAFARNMRIYGTSEIDRMAALREAQGQFREAGLDGSSALAGAKMAMPLLSKLDFLGASLDDESRASLHQSNLSLLRFVESSGGLKSPEEFNRIADQAFKLQASTGKTVDYEQLRQFKARAGAAGYNLTDRAMAALEPVLNEMKGGAAGFGLSTMFNRVTGAIKIPNQIAHEFVDYGIWDKDKVIFNNQGGIKSFNGNPLSKDKTELLGTDPEMFYEKFIRPIWQKMNLSPVDVARQNIMAFGKTGGANMTLVENQLDVIHRAVDSFQKTQGINQAYDTAKGTLGGQMTEFDSAWTDFNTLFGTKMLPFFTKILTIGADGLRNFPDPDTFAKKASALPGFLGLPFKIGEAWNTWNQPNEDLIKGGAVARGPIDRGNPMTVNVMVDKTKLGSVTLDWMNNQLKKSQTGGTSTDFSMMPTPAGVVTQ